VILRAYQQSALERMRCLFRSGRRRVLLIAPTGSGKTVIASEIIRSATARGNRVVFIAHRRELISQCVDKLARFGVTAGVMMGKDTHTPEATVQVCSVMTLLRRELPPADLVIVDEAHHAVSESFKKILDGYPTAAVVGLTATPWRTDRMGLADLFDGHVVAATYPELLAEGSLVPYDAFAYDSPVLDEVPLVAGEYNQKHLEVACNTSVLVGSVVREYLEHGGGRRALLFAAGVRHSQALVEEMTAAGIEAVHLDYKTPSEERDRALAAFGAGDIRVVSSVGILTEGFDQPAAEVAIVARPTKSLSLHLQMLGRILRPAHGKQRALVHDHGGNLLRHGLIEDERDYSPSATPGRVVAVHTCSFCNLMFSSLRRGNCPNCGQLIAPPPEERIVVKPRRSKREVDGTRVDIVEILRRRNAAGLRVDVSPRDLERLGLASSYQKRAEFLRLRGIAQERGWARTWPWKIYHETFGEMPRWSEAELSFVKPARFPFLPVRKRRSA
jgi:DNA repair protein RadD